MESLPAKGADLNIKGVLYELISRGTLLGQRLSLFKLFFNSGANPDSRHKDTTIWKYYLNCLRF